VLTNLSLSRADYIGIWEPHPPGTVRACPDLSRVAVLCKYCKSTICNLCNYDLTGIKTTADSYKTRNGFYVKDTRFLSDGG
jgi:hypothetical protein